MPRPKVPLSRRQRAVGACNFCRSSKKRCSGTVPCTACVRRGRSDSCFLPQSQHRPRDATSIISPGTSPDVRRPAARDERVTAESAFIPETHQTSSNAPSRPEDQQPMESPNDQTHVDANESAPQDQASEQAPVGTPELHYEPRSRMLRNLRGDQGEFSFTFNFASPMRFDLPHHYRTGLTGGGRQFTLVERPPYLFYS